MGNKVAYICSPYRGEIRRNKEYARYLTRVAMNNGFAPVTVHLYMTEVLDEDKPEERNMGLLAGQRVLEQCKYIIVGNKYGISEGMTQELMIAALKGIVVLQEDGGKLYLQGSKEELYMAYIMPREGADTLLQWLCENKFFDQPASTKYHNNYAGGLAEHSIDVFRRLVHIAEEEDVRAGRTYAAYTVDTLAVAALLHDVCKTDAYKIEKKNQKQPDGKWAEVETYAYTNNLPLGHGEKSIMLIMQHMKLTEEEMVAINWHMGGFDYRVKGGCYDMNHAFDNYKLAAMLHIADMQATYLDERKEVAAVGV